MDRRIEIVDQLQADQGLGSTRSIAANESRASRSSIEKNALHFSTGSSSCSFTKPVDDFRPFSGRAAETQVHDSALTLSDNAPKASSRNAN